MLGHMQKSTTFGYKLKKKQNVSKDVFAQSQQLLFRISRKRLLDSTQTVPGSLNSLIKHFSTLTEVKSTTCLNPFLKNNNKEKHGEFFT